MTRLLAVLTCREAPLATLTARDGAPGAPPVVELELAPLPWVRPLSTVLLLGERN